MIAQKHITKIVAVVMAVAVCLCLCAVGFSGQIAAAVGDTEIRSNLKSYHDFRRLLDSGTLTEKQVEDIIERITYTEDKLRLKRYLRNNFSTLNSKDIDYIARLN